jgi:DNA-binding HxlR family transcriptional regulator
LPTENYPPRRIDGIERAADVLGDRWRILVLREAFYGVRRYGEMVRNLGIARNVLALRLKTLVADGLLERRRYRTDPDWYEYVLTGAGRDLYGTILATLHWADRHLPSTGEQQLRLRHVPCGELTHAEVVCAVCGRALDPRDVAPEPRNQTRPSGQLSLNPPARS